MDGYLETVKLKTIYDTTESNILELALWFVNRRTASMQFDEFICLQHVTFSPVALDKFIEEKPKDLFGVSAHHHFPVRYHRLRVPVRILTDSSIDVCCSR